MCAVKHGRLLVTMVVHGEAGKQRTFHQPRTMVMTITRQRALRTRFGHGSDQF